MRKIISRPDPLQLPSLPLPIHVRSVGYNEADCGWFERVPGRQKNFVQLFWCVKGTGEILLDKRIIRLAPGEVFYHLPQEEHHHRAVDPDSRWCYYWFTFDGPRAAEFMSSYGYPQSSLYAGECPVKYFLEIESLLKQRTPYAQRHAVALAAELLALAGGKMAGSREHDLVKRFIELAHEGFSDPEVTVGSLAEELGIHRTTLNRIFFRMMSLSPGTYLDQIRIQHALSLLRETELPVKEISYACGITYVSYFCRLIRKNTGMTPADYRRRSTMD